MSNAGNPEDPQANKWLERIRKSHKYYDDWSNKFQCDKLEEYYYGFQWNGQQSDQYVMNFVFSTIEVKKPSLLFNSPLFKCKPKPVGAEFDFTVASHRAQTCEDIINSIVSNENEELEEEFESFVVDAFFRFGVMEVDYSADWIENPNAGKPILKSDNDSLRDPDQGNDILREPKELPQAERVYFKRIPPWRFRVGGLDGRSFKKCSWVGYYEYYRIQDIKANKNLDNIDKLEYAGARSNDYDGKIGGEILSADAEEDLKSGDLIKIWKIWDIRQKKKFIFCENNGGMTLLEKKYKNLPLVALKFVEKLRGWYPVPMVFNWKSPQDEINEARQQQRIHRRRASRKYLYGQGRVSTEELNKLETGDDMTFAEVQGDPAAAIRALEQPPNDSSVAQAMLVSRDDMNIITGTSMEQRGQSDRTTATQASLIDQRTTLRESRARFQVAKALRRIAFLTLATVKEHFTFEFWAKLRTNEFNEDPLADFQEAKEEWMQFTARDIGDPAALQIDISVDTISPIENEKSKQSFVEFLSLITQFPQLSFDPVLVREAAYRCGYRNEKVIARMAQLAMIAAIGRVEMAKGQLAQVEAQMGGGVGAQPQQPGNLAQTRVEQMQPPTGQQVANQLGSQLGTGQVQ